MTLSEISNIRLRSQKIEAAEFRTALEVVAFMGAIQAQDYLMAKWAIGLRIPYSTDKQITSALDKGEILRTHLLRPTWHFVSAEDIYWLLELTAPQIKSALKSRRKELELSESIFTKCSLIIEKLLSDRNSLSREELAIEINNAGIRTDGNRLSHILLSAESDGIICSGPVKANKQTFSLLHDRVPNKKILTRDESLVELAKRYFNSRYPATLHDFIWWSGLSHKDARHALESVKNGFITEIIKSKEYLLPDSFPVSDYTGTSVHLLPAYDEFLLSYKDRSASHSFAYTKKTVSNNGIFYPVIVVNGQIAGIWKRSIKKNKYVFEPIFFYPQDKATTDLLEEKASLFGKFFDKEIEVISANNAHIP